MEFETNFKDDFPYYSNISLENNPPKLDSSNLKGDSKPNNIQDFLNSHPFTTPLPSHPHQHYQDVHFHGHGHDSGYGHNHSYHPIDNHHHRIFSTDLNIVPPFVMPDNNTIAASYHLDGNNHEHHVSYHHHDPRGHGDVPMIPLEQIFAFHDVNNMPRDDSCLFESPIADADERKGKKKVVAQPEGEAIQGVTEIKGQWAPEEDRRLIQLVERHGVKRWSIIAKELGRRVGKQCRERWHNHLRPDIRKDVWSLEEDMILIKAHREFGNKWCKIAKLLPGRSENTIKNHWNATKRKQCIGRSKPGGSSDGSGSTLLQDYINSTMPPSSLANKKKEKKRSKRNNDTSANEMAAANNISSNNNLESSNQIPYRFL